MATVIQELWNAGPLNDPITLGDTTATIHTGGDATFTDSPVLEGAFSANFAATGSQIFYRWDFAPTLTEIWVNVAVYLTESPTVPLYICALKGASNFAIADVRINADRTVSFRNGFGGASGILDSATVLPLNQWHSITMACEPLATSGSRLKIYSGDGPTPTEDLVMDSTRAGPITNLNFGVIPNTTFTFITDRLIADNAEEPARPAVGDVTDPVPVVVLASRTVVLNSSDEVTSVSFSVDASGSTDDTAVTAYSWSDGGAGGSFNDNSIASPVWTPPDLVSGPWTLTCAVSDAAANSASGAVVVDSVVTTGSGSPVTAILVASS